MMKISEYTQFPKLKSILQQILSKAAQMKGTQLLVFILIILLTLLTSSLAAQDSTDLDFQTWTDLTTIYSFNNRWMYSGDYGIRGVLFGQDWYTFYIRPTFRFYPAQILNVRAGAAMFFTRDPVTDNQLEIRFHQEANLKWPQVVGFVVRHMIRFEERIKKTEN